MSPSPEIREATGEDWPLWRELRLRALGESPGAFGSTYERELAFTEAAWRGRLDGVAGPAVLATIGSRTVGMGAGFRDLPGWLHVVAMWTEPELRGAGVGTAVLAWLADWADRNQLRLHLDVAQSNPRARQVYERAGFVATGEIRPLRDGAAEQVERLVLARSRR
ncbi:GNAT family N-acetyltransferase [Nocardioides mesophilus]|uniref:GNAT family N-acetyltransferase n=1 Tax=Nocardioides mesophilus TaxID=433659 RepID=A0A7G9RCK2_9ACTN|nr:GNAT family N-acetyltransferase [Nocardioides mesophilus]QNN53327.1 GNAT family N-acetyltransferase [Nocardioides mesophilus]